MVVGVEGEDEDPEVGAVLVVERNHPLHKPPRVFLPGLLLVKPELQVLLHAELPALPPLAVRVWRRVEGFGTSVGHAFDGGSEGFDQLRVSLSEERNATSL